MHPDLSLVVRLQDLDNRAAELKREISALPKHITEIERQLVSHERKLEADRAALSANYKDRKKLEGDIQIQEQKISKLKGQSLEVKTNEQYRALLSEIEYCQNEIRRCEDRILEMMSESEPLEKNVKTAEDALKLEKSRVESEKQDARERTAADKRALDELEGERKQMVADLSANVHRLYEQVRHHRAGIAVAEATDGRCGACHLAMRLQFFQDLKRGNQIMNCESCGRILFYNPPASVEDLAGESAPAIQG
jgi:hypothetical protein